MIIWYDVAFKHLRLAAAVSLSPYAQEWGAHYRVVQEIYESDPGYGRMFKHRAFYPEQGGLTWERWYLKPLSCLYTCGQFA